MMFMRKLSRTLCFSAIILFLSGPLWRCQPEKINTPVGNVNFSINYKVGSKNCILDSLMYVNAAGNAFDVHHLEYYISDLVLIGADGSRITRNDIFYINLRDPLSNQITVSNVALKQYTGLRFLIGLNADTNRTGVLPPLHHNLNMFWPDPMGGGYHFLKFEGHFLDSTNNLLGYALHLGTNTCLVNVIINQDFTLSEPNSIMTLTMDLSEWFYNPYTYDLNASSYIMGNQEAMKKIAANGTNVFSINQ